MALGKVRHRIRSKIPSWKCYGYFGYGHGRAMVEVGDKQIRGRSVCSDFCKEVDGCRAAHHSRMDARYPEVAKVVRETARAAEEMKRPIVSSVIAAMQVAEKRNVPGIGEMRRIISQHRVAEMTDHYTCGQFENIQNGIEKKDPQFLRPIPESATASVPVDQEAESTLEAHG